MHEVLPVETDDLHRSCPHVLPSHAIVEQHDGKEHWKRHGISSIASDLDAVQQWLNGIHPRSQRHYRVAIAGILFWAMQVRRRALCELSPSDIDEYVDFLQDIPPEMVGRSQGLGRPELWRPFGTRFFSGNTIRARLHQIGTYWKFMLEVGMQVQPTCNQIYRRTAAASVHATVLTRPPRREYPSLADLFLVEHALALEHPWSRLMEFKLVAYTGLDLSVIQELTWTHVRAVAGGDACEPITWEISPSQEPGVFALSSLSDFLTELRRSMGNPGQGERILGGVTPLRSTEFRIAVQRASEIASRIGDKAQVHRLQSIRGVSGFRNTVLLAMMERNLDIFGVFGSQTEHFTQGVYQYYDARPLSDDRALSALVKCNATVGEEKARSLTRYAITYADQLIRPRRSDLRNLLHKQDATTRRVAPSTRPTLTPESLKSRFPRILHTGAPSVHIGTGWLQLLFDLLTAIDAELTDDEAVCLQTVGVKEKFGLLRLMFEVLSHEETARQEVIKLLTWRKVHRLACVAQARSASICMCCGLPGHLRYGRWQRVSCDACERSGSVWYNRQVF